MAIRCAGCPPPATGCVAGRACVTVCTAFVYPLAFARAAAGMVACRRAAARGFSGAR
jgi:hypothetical protein